MASKIKVQITVMIEDHKAASGAGMPTYATYEHVSMTGGDNPRFLASKAQDAVGHAARDVMDSIGLHIDLSE